MEKKIDNTKRCATCGITLQKTSYQNHNRSEEHSIDIAGKLKCEISGNVTK